MIDGASGYSSRSPDARPGRFVKHVVLRADRADGFVAYNFMVRGAKEHGIYVEETDGYRIDRMKMYWAADYGNLTFTSDHGLYTDCDGYGAGDAVVYPGGAPETGEQADRSFYPDAPRINTVVRRCDLHGSVLAYSGSMGNAVRITRNQIYGNTAGISTDTISASGHPGYPADSVQIDHNYIYSNNLSLFRQPAGPARGRRAALGRRHLLGRPQQRPRVQTTGSGTTGATAPPCFRSPTSCSRPRATSIRAGPARTRCSRPRAATATSTTSSVASRRGSSRSRRDQVRQPGRRHQGRGPQRRGLLVGRGPARDGVRQLLVPQHRSRRKASSVTGPGVGDGNDLCPPTARRASATATTSSSPACSPASSRGRDRYRPSSATGTRCRRQPGSAAAARKQQRFAAGARAFLEAPRRRTPSRPGEAGDRGGAGCRLAELSAVGERGDDRVGEMLAGSVAPMAQCTDWNGGTRARRLATIEDIREQVNLKDSAVQTPPLSDNAAYGCSTTPAAEAFAGQLPALQALRAR